MITAHFKKLKLRSAISAEDERLIRGLISETRRVGPDQVIVRAGEELHHSLLLLDGLAGSIEGSSERRAASAGDPCRR